MTEYDIGPAPEMEMDAEDELVKLRDLTVARNEATAWIRREIANLQDELKEIETPYNQEITKQTGLIERILMTQKKSVHSDCGDAVYTKAYDRITWDDKELLKWASTHTEVMQFRRATHVHASVRIKLNI